MRLCPCSQSKHFQRLTCSSEYVAPPKKTVPLGPFSGLGPSPPSALTMKDRRGRVVLAGFGTEARIAEAEAGRIDVRFICIIMVSVYFGG